MPMRRACGNPYRVADIQHLSFLTLIADPAGAGHDAEELPVLVSMPVSPGARGEHDVSYRCVGGYLDRVEPDVAGEGFARFDSAGARCAGVADYGAGHDA